MPAKPSSKWPRSQCQEICSTKSCGGSTGYDDNRLQCRSERNGSAITEGGMRLSDEEKAERMDRA
jgi:hypothetical protein